MSPESGDGIGATASVMEAIVIAPPTGCNLLTGDPSQGPRAPRLPLANFFHAFGARRRADLQGVGGSPLPTTRGRVLTAGWGSDRRCWIWFVANCAAWEIFGSNDSVKGLIWLRVSVSPIWPSTSNN